MPKRKVLVIDDEKPTLSMFQLFLRAYGYEVLLAENGSQGLKIFESESPAIVFTDIKMPGMDGFEVLDRIKSQAPETEVIVITGHGDMDLAVQALNHEATDFINKPIHRSALDAALQRAEVRIQSVRTEAAVIDSLEVDDIRIIEIKGNIKASSERELTAAFTNAAGNARILLRFHDSTAINGAGIGVLIQLLAERQNRQGKVAISGISENLARIFDMVGITRLAKIFALDREAQTYLQGPGE
ncbi:response regulator [Desulfosarcina sp.]|uniref:response regulator n=1 Tax=Desulfosarcina sp. TaxID=2027861 RepID=UPI0039710A6A